ncbi:hypothetical protein [Gaoshiqia sp. Z1-71]|uniref:hypothetical protein n=1 Tax=Gaoshiqia hydrogeniformans TaxID=3290090 RepID=UPI003BF80682
MKNTDQYLAEIKEIRKMMEQSSRFLSLSGLSGILVGIYAILGAFIAYRMIYLPAPSIYRKVYPQQVLDQLILLAAVLLLASFITVIWLTTAKTKKSGQKFWNTGSRLLCMNLAIPLISGGILILIFTFRGIYSLVAPFCLVFYGLALVNAAKYTRQEIFNMGLFQILLGILSAVFPGLGLIFWALGFGLVHIIYGIVMYFRYERKTQTA